MWVTTLQLTDGCVPLHYVHQESCWMLFQPSVNNVEVVDGCCNGIRLEVFVNRDSLLATSPGTCWQFSRRCNSFSNSVKISLRTQASDVRFRVMAIRNSSGNFCIIMGVRKQPYISCEISKLSSPHTQVHTHVIPPYRKDYEDP